MSVTTYGYVRVSTKEQHEDRQLIALSEFDIPKHNIYIDKISGKNFERPAYRRLLKKMKKGSLLIIKSIDRLGRNYDEVLEQWRVITKEKMVDIKVIDMPLLDTTYGKDLLGNFISDLVLAVLSYAAELERENIRQRQAEGIAAALARGVKFGQPPKYLPDNFPELYDRWMAEEYNAAHLAGLCGMSRTTLFKRVKEYRSGLEPQPPRDNRPKNVSRFEG